jgi:tight adherence protein C
MSELTLLLLFFAFVLASVCSAGYFVLYRTSGLAEGASTKDVLAETFRSLGDVLPSRSTNDLRNMLMSAGHRSQNAVSIYNGISYSAAVLLGVVGAALADIAWGEASSALVFGVCSAGIAHLGSKRVLARMVRARAGRLNAGLPTALDMLVLSVEAGQSLDQSIYDASRELRGAFPDLADELTQAYLSLRANTSRAQVFREFGDRNPDSELRKLSTLLVDSDRFGSSLAPALRTHARYLRIRRRQHCQEQARKVSTKLVFPIFFLIFPAVLVVTLGPAIIQLMTALPKFMK